MFTPSEDSNKNNKSQKNSQIFSLYVKDNNKNNNKQNNTINNTKLTVKESIM